MPVMLPNLRSANEGLAKSPTGIRGFDDITGGGLPQPGADYHRIEPP